MPPPVRHNLLPIRSLIRDGGACHTLVIGDSIGSRGADSRHFGAISRIFEPSRWVGCTMTTRMGGSVYDGSQAVAGGTMAAQYVAPKADSPVQFTIPAARDEDLWPTNVSELRATGTMGAGTTVATFTSALESGQFAHALDGPVGAAVYDACTHARGIFARGASANLALGTNLRWRGRRATTNAKATATGYTLNSGASDIAHLETTLPSGSPGATVGGQFLVGASSWLANQYLFSLDVLVYDDTQEGFQLAVWGMDGGTVRHWSEADGGPNNLIDAAPLASYLEALRQPNLIIIHLGQNDGLGDPANRYKTDVLALIAKIRAASTVDPEDLWVLLIAPPKDNSGGDETRYANYAERLYEVASTDAYGTVGFVDLYQLTIDAWPTMSNPGPDQVHPQNDAQADMYWQPVWDQILLGADPQPDPDPDPEPTVRDAAPLLARTHSHHRITVRSRV